MNEIKHIFNTHNLDLNGPLIFLCNGEVTVLKPIDIINKVLGLRSIERDKILLTFQKFKDDKQKINSLMNRLGECLLNVKL